MKTKTTIGVIGAMDSEIAGLTSKLLKPETVKIADLTFHIGQNGEKTIIIVKSGVGKVNAARCTQLLIDRFSPDCIINSGIAGGIDPALSVGDVVIGRELVQHDFDATAFGYAKGYLLTGEPSDRPTVFYANEKLVSLLEQTARRIVSPKKVRSGRIASGDLFVSDASAKQDIWNNFRACAAEMEGAAIAQTAAYNGVPFVVLRVISDQADGKAAQSFETFEKETADLSASIIESLLITI